MDLGVISVRYARALLKSAVEQKREAEVYREMQTLAQSYLQVPGLRLTIDNPTRSGWCWKRPSGEHPRD